MNVKQCRCGAIAVPFFGFSAGCPTSYDGMHRGFKDAGVSDETLKAMFRSALSIAPDFDVQLFWKKFKSNIEFRKKFEILL